jgi:hypothetical protein
MKINKKVVKNCIHIETLEEYYQLHYSEREGQNLFQKMQRGELTLSQEVFNAAFPRRKTRKTKYCDICGISSNEETINRHHIIPKSKGGKYSKEGSLYLCNKHHKDIHTNDTGKILWKEVNEQVTKKFQQIITEKNLSYDI